MGLLGPHLRCVVEALTSAPGVGMVLATDEGIPLWANRSLTEMIYGADAKPENYCGRPWHETMPEAWVRERLGMLREMRRTGEACMVRAVWRGRQHLACWHPIDRPDDPSKPATFFAFLRRMDGRQLTDETRGNEHRLIDSSIIDPGVLGVLSKRELEVLALIGQGLSMREIAKVLCRSEKTIDGHRQSIGRKLGAASKSQLATIATHSGLRVEDAAKTRAGEYGLSHR